jgi:hypothetical protein
MFNDTSGCGDFGSHRVLQIESGNSLNYDVTICMTHPRECYKRRIPDNTVPPSRMTGMVTLLTCIGEVPGSTPGRYTDYLE